MMTDQGDKTVDTKCGNKKVVMSDTSEGMTDNLSKTLTNEEVKRK